MKHFVLIESKKKPELKESTIVTEVPDKDGNLRKVAVNLDPMLKFLVDKVFNSKALDF